MKICAIFKMWLTLLKNFRFLITINNQLFLYSKTFAFNEMENFRDSAKFLLDKFPFNWMIVKFLFSQVHRWYEWTFEDRLPLKINKSMFVSHRVLLLGNKQQITIFLYLMGSRRSECPQEGRIHWIGQILMKVFSRFKLGRVF